MAAIDSKRASTSMKSWATFVQLAASRPRSKPFATLEEYLPYRIIDAGEMYNSLPLFINNY
jgi:fusicocca-2,10(14)-diene synthase